MIPPSPSIVALVTAPDLETARKLARAALEKRLAACANLVPQIESHYWWQRKLEQSAEVLVIFKTNMASQQALLECVLAHHPYEVPEFVTLPITGGSDAYLSWIRQNVAAR